MLDEFWRSDAQAQKRLESFLAAVHAGDRLTAKRWLGGLEEQNVAPSSNIEAQELPFQRWYRFKEAFSPRFVFTAISSLEKRPRFCVDPFGGSGTTALTCQFLGVQPATIEVNPFLADLIEAKLATYDLTKLIADYAAVTKKVRSLKGAASEFAKVAPPTFVEPGVDGRWIFDKPVVKRLLAYRKAIESVDDKKNQRFLKVLLGSIAVKLSNVVISGKGRRYRSGWDERVIDPDIVDQNFADCVERAIRDVSRFGRRAECEYTLLRGDSRHLVDQVPEAEFALFSPPYPNSFDYTDIYNVELWLLGYLTSMKDNRALREATVRSHVQIKRSYECELLDSRLLRKTLKALERKSDELWDNHIPAMVNAYFADMATIIGGLARKMAKGADVMMVIGDSRYAGVRVDVASICSDIAPSLGFKIKSAKPIRAMRASAQQGGHRVLSETLLHLKRAS